MTKRSRNGRACVERDPKVSDSAHSRADDPVIRQVCSAGPRQQGVQVCALEAGDCCFSIQHFEFAQGELESRQVGDMQFVDKVDFDVRWKGRWREEYSNF